MDMKVKAISSSSLRMINESGNGLFNCKPNTRMFGAMDETCFIRFWIQVEGLTCQYFLE